MIISHQYRYVFVELPRTGSTAVSHELCELYGGVPVLYRHATLEELWRIAPKKVRDYFVFSGIRNPLDDAVSLYFKYRNDHKGQFSAIDNGRFFTRLVNFPRLRRFRYIRQQDAGFAAYFLRFYSWPYNNWSAITHSRCDFVIRFEHLAADFERVLRLIGLEPQRPLPVVNKTAGKRQTYLSYYDTPEVRRRAVRVFGPFMKMWGYEFPPEWGDVSVPHTSWLLFHLLNGVRVPYWKYVRPYVLMRVLRERGQEVRPFLETTS
ncbi:MAG: hypothetical protein D6706_02635 [Chloroflexi bacterium]|nr:MAG: hypothetical protein D6706_02635 [Chloroflexota bacterium]